MGSTLETEHNKLNSAINPSFEQWQITQKGDTFNIYKNKFTHEELEQYNYNPRDSREYQQIKEFFFSRYQKEYLVSTKFFKQIINKQICSTFYAVSIYNQRISLRLNSLEKIKYPSILHLYKACLLGFKQIYEKIGYLNINQQYIGINSQGKIKVWMHSNFGSYRPLLSIYKSERDFVKQIIQMIYNYSDTSGKSKQLKQYINKYKNFKNTLIQLNNYAKKQKIEIYSCLHPEDIIYQANHIKNQIIKKPQEKQSLMLFKQKKNRNNQQHTQNQKINNKQQQLLTNFKYLGNSTYTTPSKQMNNQINLYHTQNNLQYYRASKQNLTNDGNDRNYIPYNSQQPSLKKQSTNLNIKYNAVPTQKKKNNINNIKPFNQEINQIYYNTTLKKELEFKVFNQKKSMMKNQKSQINHQRKIKTPIIVSNSRLIDPDEDQNINKEQKDEVMRKRVSSINLLNNYKKPNSLDDRQHKAIVNSNILPNQCQMTQNTKLLKNRIQDNPIKIKISRKSSYLNKFPQISKQQVLQFEQHFSYITKKQSIKGNNQIQYQQQSKLSHHKKFENNLILSSKFLVQQSNFNK